MVTSLRSESSDTETAPALRVIGNLTIDAVFKGVAEMPHWGVEVIATARAESVAGQAGNLAFAAARLGVATDVVAVVGADSSGRRIRHALQSAGVGVHSVHLAEGAASPMTVAIVRPDGERSFISYLGDELATLFATLAQPEPTSASPTVVALVGTFNVPGYDSREAAPLLRAWRTAGSLTAFDSGWDPGGWPDATREAVLRAVGEADYFLPNLDEAHAITGCAALGDLLASLRDACPGTVIVKAGAVGSYVVSEERPAFVESIPTHVDNAVGAGDVFNAGLIARHLSGATILQSAAFATAAASLYVGRSSDRFPSFDECAALESQVRVSAV